MATANAILDSALIAWKKSLAFGRAPDFVNEDRRVKNALILQFTARGGLAVERVLDGRNLEIHLSPPEVARPRAYGRFRFRLGLACDHVAASGTWQYHRALPEGARLSSARLVRQRVADKERWSLQLVLRLAEPLRLNHAPKSDLAAIHFGWAKGPGGRRVATVARSEDPTRVESIVLSESVERDLTRCAELQGRRAEAHAVLIPQLAKLNSARHSLPAAISAELTAIGALPNSHVAFGRLYRLQKGMSDAGVRRDWLDAWVREDRMRWAGAVSLARRARGRRRDFYRCAALKLARDHGALVLELLDLKAASRAIDHSSSHWSSFSRHARAGRVVAAPHEFEQAIR